MKIVQSDKEKVAKALTDIFDLNYEGVIKKVNQNVSVVNIAKKKPKELTDKLRVWMEQNNISTRNQY